MATATHTTKRLAKRAVDRRKPPVTVSERLDVWLNGYKTRVRKTLRKWYHEFLVFSTVAFWAFVAGFMITHWPF